MPTNQASIDADILALQSDLPDVITPKRLADALETTVDALAQDRYRGRGVKYVRIGGPESRRIRYLKADVIRHLAENRSDFC